MHTADLPLDRWLRRPPGRMLAGAAVGGATGLVLLVPAALVALFRLVTGAPVLTPEDARTIGDPLRFVAGYALSFAAGGAVYGLLWPWRRTRWSAALVGVASMLPLLMGLGVLVLKDWTLLRSPVAWTVAAVAALVTGPILGLQLRDLGQEETGHEEPEDEDEDE